MRILIFISLLFAVARSFGIEASQGTPVNKELRDRLQNAALADPPIAERNPNGFVVAVKQNDQATDVLVALWNLTHSSNQKVADWSDCALTLIAGGNLPIPVRPEPPAAIRIDIDNFLIQHYQKASTPVEKLRVSLLIRQCHDKLITEFADQKAIPDLPALVKQVRIRIRKPAATGTGN
jgi:hypothetical protein